MQDDELATKVGEKIAAIAADQSISESVWNILTTDLMNLSRKRFTSAQAKEIAEQLIDESKKNANSSQIRQT